MRLAMLLGHADGKVFSWHEQAAPREFRVPMEKDNELGLLYTMYKCIAVSQDEAYYAPEGYSSFRIIQELANR